MTGKRNLFVGLLIGLVLGGVLPAFLSLHNWTSAQDSRQVLLRQGWNQLVWTGDDQPADTALAAVAADLAIVYSWRGDSQTFARYIPGRTDVNTMSMLEEDGAYWLLLKRDVFLSIPAGAGACPEPTACPSPSPSADCGECASLLAACVSALDACDEAYSDCDESFWGMADLLDECHADVTSCRADVTSCHADVTFWMNEALHWKTWCHTGMCCDYCY
jgi:hypothetical protein